jgi:hypothetical protein
MAFADDQIIDAGGDDADGTYGFPLAGQGPLNVGNYFLSVMSSSWSTCTIDVRVKDRSGNYLVPNDADGNPLSGKTANFAANILVGRSGLDLELGGSGTASLTVTLEKSSD